MPPGCDGSPAKGVGTGVAVGRSAIAVAVALAAVAVAAASSVAWAVAVPDTTVAVAWALAIVTAACSGGSAITHRRSEYSCVNGFHTPAHVISVKRASSSGSMGDESV